MLGRYSFQLPNLPDGLRLGLLPHRPWLVGMLSVLERCVPEGFDVWLVAQVDPAEVGNAVTVNFLVRLMITG
ncbi:hypothetical protein ABZV67_39320 [Streptomyces sp. NPDC005065]|uniref:hypothetical protein n=1 Tax=Streptomyces sp. NPDC005065 TaxID=3154461 RepID=UPI0033B9D3D2